MNYDKRTAERDGVQWRQASSALMELWNTVSRSQLGKEPEERHALAIENNRTALGVVAKFRSDVDDLTRSVAIDYPLVIPSPWQFHYADSLEMSYRYLSGRHDGFVTNEVSELFDGFDTENFELGDSRGRQLYQMAKVALQISNRHGRI